MMLLEDAKNIKNGEDGESQEVNGDVEREGNDTHGTKLNQ
jgi:hypothetical protein